jgi:RNA recognition motif-containing protein
MSTLLLQNVKFVKNDNNTFGIYDLSETELKEAFQGFGEVQSCNIIKDKFTGESRGFGFVEMPNKDEADKAIAALNGKDLKGRNLRVNEARPRTDRPRTGGGGGGGSRRY